MLNTEFDRLNSVASVRITDCDGVTIVWRVWGDGPPLILLHGSAGSWTHWLRNIDALATARTVYVPDMPGFGDSSMAPEPHTFTQLARILLSGFETLCPDTTFDLAGFSFGSIVAESIALERPERLRRLVLVRGRYDDLTPSPPRNLKRWRDIDDPHEMALAQRHNLSVLMFHDSASIDEETVQIHLANSRRERVNPALFFASRPINALSKIKSPICAVAGEFDCLALPNVAEQADKLHRTNANASFKLIPNAGHWVNYEAAIPFNAIFLAFLEPQKGSGS
jgi:2-hydroxy-6-oxonona-2,4-dienedioate hydrolase